MWPAGLESVLPGVRGRFAVGCCLLAALSGRLHVSAAAEGDGQPRLVDLSLLVAPDLPCSWSAGFPPFQINHYQRLGPLSAVNSDILSIDEHTGTQFDAPAHFIPPPDSGFPHAGRFGTMTGDKVPISQFMGEACVIDCADLVDSAPKGASGLVTRQHVVAWEKKHRRLGPGDVVVFRSGFSDKFYQPFPAGRRFIADPVEGTSPAWPDPDPPCMEYLASRGVTTLATDSPSMGPLGGDLPILTHLAGLQHGMIWTEGATGLGQLPPTGAFYAMIGPKHAGSSGTEGRALAVVGDSLADRLIESARSQRVADLSLLLAEDLPVWWPGPGTGNHRHPYYNKVVHTFGQVGGPYFAQTHRMDSHTGTHLVPPAYSLPPEGFDNRQYAPEVQEWLAEYEAMYGPRGTSDVTTEKVPLAQTCGWARVIDVRHLVGTTDRKAWPASPEITVADIRKFESEQGEFQPGEIVIFYSGYSDLYVRPFPEGDACLTDPLNGRREGWPAPGPAAIFYLAEKGLACVATDGPTLGGAQPKRALWTYWALGSKGMVGVEYLTNVGSLPGKAYFIFAPVKIRGCHGGPGRAVALF